MTATDTSPAPVRKPDWRDNAACRHEPSELFFPTGTTGPCAVQIEQAKAVCRRCPSIDACLTFALDEGIPSGIFGGLTEDERRKVRSNNPSNRASIDAFTGTSRSKAQPMTLAESMAAYTEDVDGHRLWVGGLGVRFQNVTYTPNQVSFYLDRGVWPTGKVMRTCKTAGCVLSVHLADEEERTRCGTTGGYQKHLREKTKSCPACRQANTDADNRLRRTGTTKATV